MWRSEGPCSLSRPPKRRPSPSTQGAGRPTVGRCSERFERAVGSQLPRPAGDELRDVGGSGFRGPSRDRSYRGHGGGSSVRQAVASNRRPGSSKRTPCRGGRRLRAPRGGRGGSGETHGLRTSQPAVSIRDSEEAASSSLRALLAQAPETSGAAPGSPTGSGKGPGPLGSPAPPRGPRSGRRSSFPVPLRISRRTTSHTRRVGSRRDFPGEIRLPPAAAPCYRAPTSVAVGSSRHPRAYSGLAPTRPAEGTDLSTEREAGR